jgi:hypothetical protein
VLDKVLVDKYFEVVQTDQNNRPLILRQIDYGTKYYTNPGSFYNDKDGSNSALPTLLNDQDKGFDEVDMLLKLGFKPL